MSHLKAGLFKQGGGLLPSKQTNHFFVFQCDGGKTGEVAFGASCSVKILARNVSSCNHSILALCWELVRDGAIQSQGAAVPLSLSLTLYKTVLNGKQSALS